MDLFIYNQTVEFVEDLEVCFVWYGFVTNVFIFVFAITEDKTVVGFGFCSFGVVFYLYERRFRPLPGFDYQDAVGRIVFGDR